MAKYAAVNSGYFIHNGKLDYINEPTTLVTEFGLETGSESHRTITEQAIRAGRSFTSAPRIDYGEYARLARNVCCGLLVGQSSAGARRLAPPADGRATFKFAKIAP